MNKIHSIFNQLVNKKKVGDRNFKFTMEEMVNLYDRNIELRKEIGGEFINNGLLNYKKSDTLFILGSGPSINDITRPQWEEIAKNDSFGFNFWFINDFVPNFYFLQFEYSDIFNEAILQVLMDKRDLYSNVPLILRGSVLSDVTFKLSDKKVNILKQFNIFYMNEYPIHSQVEIEIQLILNYLHRLEMMNFGKISKFTPKLRTTLNLLLVLAFQMGYKEIVLCGMDMNPGVTHFWDSNEYNTALEKYSLNELKAAAKDFSHFTSKSFSKNTVPEYVINLRDLFLAKANVKLSVISDSTLLYPDLPIYTGITTL